MPNETRQPGEHLNPGLSLQRFTSVGLDELFGRRRQMEIIHWFIDFFEGWIPLIELGSEG